MVYYDSILDIQRNMARRLTREVAMDNVVRFLEIVQSVVSDRSGRMSKETIILEAVQSGLFSEEEAIVTLDALIQDRTLKDEDGFVRF